MRALLWEYYLNQIKALGGVKIMFHVVYTNYTSHPQILSDQGLASEEALGYVEQVLMSAVSFEAADMWAWENA